MRASEVLSFKIIHTYKRVVKYVRFKLAPSFSFKWWFVCFCLTIFLSMPRKSENPELPQTPATSNLTAATRHPTARWQHRTELRPGCWLGFTPTSNHSRTLSFQETLFIRLFLTEEKL